MNDALPDPELLVGIAALGLTVTGFSGLVSVLGRRASGRWSQSERFQLTQLLETSLVATFSAFIPILVALVARPTVALPTATAAVAVAHLVVLARGVFAGFLRDGPGVANLPTGLALFIVAGGLGIILASLVASLGFIGGLAFLIVLNLVWELMVSVVHFVALLLRTGNTDAD